MTKSTRILIVEDEFFIRKSLQCFFESEGFCAHAASCACEAMTHLAEKNTDVCLTDIGLPDCEEIEWIPQTASLYPTVQWIIYTGAIGYSLPEKLLEVGIKKEHLFYKPSLSLNLLKELLISL